jgi:hypothetical protein
MEFNIRKGSTLPFIEVDYLKDGNKDYNFSDTNLSNATIYFYMKNVDTGVYKIAKGVSTYDSINNKIYYQFSKKNTSDVGRYEGEFKIENKQNIIESPLIEKIYINVLPSFSDSNFCCPNKSINPTPIPPSPAPSGIYYGKFSGETITSGDVSNLLFELTNDPTNSYVTFPLGSSYGYILIPVSLSQPTGFRDSDNGCSGFNIPINNIGQIIIKDGNNFPITYNVYRSFYQFFGDTDCWLCN